MRYTSLLFLLSFLFLSSQAQRFKGGLIGGLNACQVDGDTYAGYHKFGLMAGAFVYLPINEKIDIQMEIKYMGKGAYKPSTDLDPTLYGNNLRYAEIPLLIRYNTKGNISWEGGFGFGYLLSYNQEDESGTFNRDQTTPFKRFEWSSIIGVTYRFPNNLGIGLRYSYSILPIYRVNSGVKDPNPYVQRGSFNNLFSLDLRYYFK